MPEKDYIHTIYVMAIILFFAPWVNALLFNFVMSGAPDYTSMIQGEFYTNGLFQITAIIMILYVTYKRFIEGWKSGREKSKQ